jgi:hypothetical protein
MNKLGSTKKRSATNRILRAAAIVFFIGWLVSAVFIIIIHRALKWNELGASATLFGGSFFSWVIALHFLKKKDKTYVDSLLEEISDKEGKQMEQHLTGDIKTTEK